MGGIVNMDVYIVQDFYNDSAYTNDTELIGVFSTQEKARKAMIKEAKKIHDFNESSIEVEKWGEDDIEFFDNEECPEFHYEIFILKREVE